MHINEMVFSCERCLAEFSQKVNLKNHLQRKKQCSTTASSRSRKEILDDLNKRELREHTSECEFCNMQFNHRSVKCRHRKICKMNPSNQETITIPTSEYLALKGGIIKHVG